MPHWWTCPVSGHNSHRLQLGMYSNYTTTNQSSHISERPQKGTKKKPQTEAATNRKDHAWKRPQSEMVEDLQFISLLPNHQCWNSLHWKTLPMPFVGKDVAVSFSGRSGLCLWPFRFVATSVRRRFGLGPLRRCLICDRFRLWLFRLWPSKHVAATNCCHLPTLTFSDDIVRSYMLLSISREWQFVLCLLKKVVVLILIAELYSK